MKNVGSLDDESKFIHGGGSKMTPEEISDIEKWAKYDSHTPATLYLARTHCLSLIDSLRIQIAERKEDERLMETERAISRKLAEELAIHGCPYTIIEERWPWCPEKTTRDGCGQPDEPPDCWIKHAKDQVEQEGKLGKTIDGHKPDCAQGRGKQCTCKRRNARPVKNETMIKKGP